jgi:hypothetical protein
MKKNIKEEILACATRIQHYNNLLIEQCDSWLSEEEGMRQMEKRIMERRKNKE